MKHAFRKIMALLLVIALIAGVVPSVFAAGYVEPFRDVKETDWFAEYVKYVYKHDPQLMDGMTPITFEPNKNCTRAMTAVVLYRLEDPVVPAVNESKFVDLTADWYKNAVAWAEENEIVNGVDKYHFNPDGLVTREQLVTMMWRYYGEPETERDYLKDFTDAKKVSAYAKEAFNWAIGKGIIGGRKIEENNKTRVELVPQGYATRAEMAKILTTAILSMEPCVGEHSWDDGVVTVKPSCEYPGEKLYTCTQCGETKTEVIPALGHTFVDGVCTVCGEKIAEADEIVIYYTNDVHSYIDGALSYDTIADMKNQTAKVAAGVLLVDDGDHIQGTAYGAMDKGKSIIEMMNAAGYDAATLGNHEFDYGMEGTMDVIRWAQYPYLSANFYHEKDGVKGANVLDSYKIFEIDGKKIAVIGITTPESFTKSTPAYFQDEAGNYIYGIAGGVTGADLYASVQSAINAAKAAGADYIIALGHLGDDASSKPWTSEDLIANTTGLNVLIDGHSHNTVEQKFVQDAGKNKVILTQTGSYFNAVGKLTINLTKNTLATELITSYNGSNSAVAALKNEWMSTVDGMLGKVIGHTSLTFDNYENGARLVRKEETNTGDFAADALYYLFDNMGLDVDVAIMNGGGVRNKAVTGDITYKTCKNIHTFGNVACLQTVTGQQILDALEWGARDVGSAECGGFLQVSGLTYDIYTNIKSTVRKDDKGYWAGGPTGDYRVSNVKIWDKEAGKYVPLDKKATYNLAGYNYTLREMGDGFAMFNGAVNVLDYVMEDYMVLANYVEGFALVNGQHEVVANSTLVPFGSDYSTVHGSGRIKIYTSGKPVDEENIFTLATSFDDGDEVIIYSPGHKMAIKNENDNNWYLVPEPVEPTNNQFVDPSEDIVWKVRKNADGTVKFTNGINEITCWVSGNYFELTNVADYEGADGNWIVRWVNGLAYIQHATFANSYGPAYIECYYNASKDKTNISGYSSSDPTPKSNDFGWQFFVKGAGGSVTPTEPTTGPTEPTTGPVTAEFALASSIKGGDEVVIYSPGHQMAIKDENDNNWYLVPQAVTVSDNKITSPDASIVWKVVDNGDGSFSFTNGSDMIVCWVSGNYFELTNDPNYAGADGKWKIDYAGGLAYIKHATFSNSYGPAYIECYYNASKDKTNVSGYSSSDPTAKSNDFGWQFYVKGASVTPTEPTTAPTSPTTGPTEPTTAPSGDFVLSSSIKGGDKVVIYSPGHQMAIKDENDNNWYLVPQAVTVSGDKISAPDASIVWTVVDNGNGTFKFTNGSDAIVCWVSGNYFELTNDPNYTGADGNWKVSWTNGLAYIQHATFSNSYGPAYIECYYNASKDKTNVSGYSSSDPTAKSNDFGWQFYVQGGSVTPTTPTEPTSGPTEPTTAPSGDYALASAIKGGDEVVIYSPGHGMAIKNENDNNWYLKPQAVTVSGSTITSPDASIVWKVVDNGDGTYSFTNGSNAIVMWVSGNYFELTNDPNYSGANGKWKVSWTDGLAYIQHSTFSNSYGPAYIECYYNSSKDVTNVSGYSSSDPTAKSADFGWQFYVKGGTVTPTEPTTAPTEPTTAPTSPTTAPGGDSFVVADSIAVGDKIVFVAAHNGTNYAMTNSTSISNALGAEVVTVNGDTVDVATRSAGSEAIWEVCAGSASGTYTLKSSDGKFISWGGSGTALSLAGTGFDLNVTCGKGVSKLLVESDRGISFRNNAGSPQFRAYKESNNSGEYSWDLTIYKLGNGSVTPTTPTEPTTAPTEPTTAPGGDEFTLTTSLKDGDQVIIYNATAKKAMSEDAVSTNYRAGADVTVSNNKIVTSDSKIIWTVKASGSGFIFSNDAGETLSATKGLSFATTDNVWAINAATTANSVYIVSTTAVGTSGDPKYIEWYDKYSEFSTYYYSDASEAIFAMQLFVKTGSVTPTEPTTAPTEPTTAPTEPTTAPTQPTTAPGGNEYVLTTSLKDGDEVIIYNAGAGKAMSEDAVSTNYRAGADVTVSNNKIVTDDSKIVWSVKASGSGFIFSNDAGETLSATKGLSFAATDNVWAVAAATTANSVYISSTTATGTSGDPKMIEWYDKYTEFSTYYYSEASEAIFAMQLFVKSGSVTPTEPTTAPTEPTTAPTEPTTAPTEPTTAPTEPTVIPGGEYFEVADSLKAGDKIVLVAEYNGKYYAMTNDASTISNALAAEEVTVSDDMVDVSTKRSAGSEAIWTLASGSEAGTFLLKSADGKYITWTSGTTIKLNDTGVNFKLTCGKGTSSALLASDASRGLLFRDNGGALQFRAYAQSNATSSGYSAVLTIFKLTQSVAPTEPTTAPTEPTTAPTEPTTAPTEPTTAPAGLPFEDGDCVVIYNAASGVIIGYEEDSDYDQSTGNYTYCNITTEAVTVSGTTLTADFENAGTFYVSINDDGTVYFVDQYDYDQSEDPENPDVYLLAAEAPDTYYDMYTDYAAFEIIAVDGGYLLKNVADDSYYCVENGVIVAKSLVEGDRSFIFQFAIWAGESDENNNIICTLSGGSVNPTEPTSAPTEPTSAPTEPTSAPTEPAGDNVFVLADELADGDEVIIYNAGARKAMSEDAVSTNYRAGVDVTVSDNKIVTDDSKIIWDVTETDTGFIFTNDAGETLSATKGLSFAATDNVWAVYAATTADSFYIVSTTAVGTSGDAKMIEWYEKYTEFSTYYYSEASEAIFAMQLFVRRGGSVTPTEPTTAPTEPTTAPTEPTTAPTEPTTAPTEPTTAPTEPTTAPSGNEYVLTTSLKDGDQVIIYNAGAKKAMSEDAVSTNYRAGADVTVSNNKIVTDDSKIVWDVEQTENGFIFSNDAGETLSATKGLSFASTDNVWAINAAKTADSVYIVSTTATGSSGDPKTVEWYDKYTEFSTYYYSEANEGIFAMQLFVLSGSVTPTEPTSAPTEPTTAPTEPTSAPTEPTTAPTEPTSAPTEPTSAPTEPTTAPTEPTTAPAEGGYVVADSLKAGDKIILVAEYNGKYYAMTNDTASISNALAAEEVSVSGGAVDVKRSAGGEAVWELAAGSTAGSFLLKSSDGKYINWTSSTSLKLSDSGVDFTLECGEGSSSVKITSTLSDSTIRALIFRDNGGALQFRAYSMSNATASGYSAVLTIFKYAEGGTTPTEPTSAPTEPTSAPTEPTSAPTEPTSAPTEPTSAPTEPTSAPTEPTSAPTEPTSAPTEPTSAPTEPTEPVTGETGYFVAEDLKAGDKIVFVAEYNGAYYAMANNTSITNALGVEAVTVSGKQAIVGDADVVWEIAAGSESGTFLLKNKDGKYINWTSSTSIKLADAGVNFALTCGEGTSKALIASDNSRGLLFRDNGGALQFRAYSQSNATATGYSSVLTIYKLTEGGTAPTEPTSAPTEPTSAPTEPTSAPTEPTTAPTEPTEPAGEGGYVVADSIKVGDKIVIVAEYSEKFYAMANDTSITNALGATEVTVASGKVTFGSADVVWEVVAGSASGTFLLKNKDGKYINWTSSTSIKLADKGVDLTITCTAGEARLMVDASRSLLFRDNGGALQFRAYAISNATTSGYSGVLTIYKLS